MQSYANTNAANSINTRQAGVSSNTPHHTTMMAGRYQTAEQQAKFITGNTKQLVPQMIYYEDDYTDDDALEQLGQGPDSSLLL